MHILYCFILVWMAGCSYDDSPDIVVKKKPKPPVVDRAWQELAPLVEESCGACHGPGKAQKGIDSHDRLKASHGRIRADQMPPGGGLDPEIKAKLLGE